jgi:hypothetical protein
MLAIKCDAAARLVVPDNIVKQIAEGRPMILALLCGGLQTHFEPIGNGSYCTPAEAITWSFQIIPPCS